GGTPSETSHDNCSPWVKHADLLRAGREGRFRRLGLPTLACFLPLVKSDGFGSLVSVQGDLAASFRSRTNGPAREFQLHAINLDFLGSFERHFHSLGRSKLEWRFARKLAPLEGHRNLDGGIRRSAILERCMACTLSTKGGFSTGPLVEARLSSKTPRP